MSGFFDRFIALTSKLISADVAPAIFKMEYMRVWRECRDAGKLEELNASVNQAFDRIFTAADAYCEDPSLRDSCDLDEEQFINEVRTIAQDIWR